MGSSPVPSIIGVSRRVYYNEIMLVTVILSHVLKTFMSAMGSFLIRALVCLAVDFLIMNLFRRVIPSPALPLYEVAWYLLRMRPADRNERTESLSSQLISRNTFHVSHGLTFLRFRRLHIEPIYWTEWNRMKTLSVGIMAVTFVLGLGAISVLFLLGKAIMKLWLGIEGRTPTSGRSGVNATGMERNLWAIGE